MATDNNNNNNYYYYYYYYFLRSQTLWRPRGIEPQVRSNHCSQ